MKKNNGFKKNNAKNYEVQAQQQQVVKGRSLEDRLHISEKNAAALMDENKILKERIESLERECGEQTAQQKTNSGLDDRALKIYRLEIERLKAFVARWERAFGGGNYNPDVAKKTAATVKVLNQTLALEPADYDLEIAKNTVGHISDYLKKPEDLRLDEDAFDLDAVLNPSGELDLEELCRELGTME